MYKATLNVNGAVIRAKIDSITATLTYDLIEAIPPHL
jgi:hypothetical protein